MLRLGKSWEIAAYSVEMTAAKSIPYPGEHATPAQLIALAAEYRRAAETLLPNIVSGKPLTRAPYILVAVQAMELYLDAFLRKSGSTAAELRGMPHNLAARTDRAVAAGLSLRQATIRHLHQLSAARTYLIWRYAPEQADGRSHLNRIEATICELARKVGAVLSERSV